MLRDLTLMLVMAGCTSPESKGFETFDPYEYAGSESQVDATDTDGDFDEGAYDTESDTETDTEPSESEPSDTEPPSDTEEPPLQDADGDGYFSDVDCDDDNAAIHPDADERCDGVDNDCDARIDDDDDDVIGQSEWYTDGDGDGWGAGTAVMACDAPSGAVAYDGDCDDSDPAYHPSAAEDCADPNDYNCDGSTLYADNDGDGWAACEECDDNDASVNPDGSETCDEVDQDCDGAVDEDASDVSKYWEDNDGDGYGLAGAFVWVCDMPAGYVENKTDCDDGDARTYPGAEEYCDAEDDDCDSVIDEDAVDGATWYSDADGDGYGDAAATTSSCDAPSGTVADSSDCDDGDAQVYPGADEYCDEADQDCDSVIDEDAVDQGTWYQDADGDGYGGEGTDTLSCDGDGLVDNTDDCDDDDADISPDAEEVCDLDDNDCDGTTDEGVEVSTWYEDADGDGYGDPDSSTTACDMPTGYVEDSDDCDDDDADINPDAVDTCDGIDGNCDGTVDDAEDCDCNMDWEGGHAYLFCTEEKSWTDAQSYCNDWGYNLAAPQDASENAWVNKRVYKIAGSSVKWWFGFNDRASEGTWEWEDGSTSSYTDWATGEPNDYGGNEDCAQFGRFTNKGWNDEPCSSTFYFVCESE